MNILSIYNSKSGADYHRIYLPMRYFPLQDGDSIKRVTEDDWLKTSDFEDVDVVFYNREQPNDFKNLLKLRERYGFKIVVDIDDYWKLYMKHPAYHQFEKAKTGDIWVWNMSEADVITTTNPRLAHKCHVFNSNVVVLPNAIPTDIEQFQHLEVENYKKVFVYTGGSSHIEDVKLMEPSFKLIAKDKEFQRLSEIHYMNKSMEFTFNLSGIGVHKDPLGLSAYMSHYIGATCSLAPLIDNTFNSMKSNLKILEAAAMKIPIIVSNCDPYLDDRALGIIRAKGDWYTQMRYIYDEPEEAVEMGELLYKDMMKKYNFEKINQQRYDLFKSLG